MITIVHSYSAAGVPCGDLITHYPPDPDGNVKPFVDISDAVEYAEDHLYAYQIRIGTFRVPTDVIDAIIARLQEQKQQRCERAQLKAQMMTTILTLKQLTDHYYNMKSGYCNIASEEFYVRLNQDREAMLDRIDVLESFVDTSS